MTPTKEDLATYNEKAKAIFGNNAKIINVSPLVVVYCDGRFYFHDDDTAAFYIMVPMMPDTRYVGTQQFDRGYTWIMHPDDVSVAWQHFEDRFVKPRDRFVTA